MSEPVTPGVRVKLADSIATMVRPRGAHTGEVVGEQGDCWKVRFDGTKTPRRICKRYIEREAA